MIFLAATVLTFSASAQHMLVAQAKKDIIAAEQNALNGNDVKKELDKVQKKLN